MDMKTYLKQATAEDREALASAVGSSVGYFYLIGGGHRRPSTDLCKRLTEAEPKLSLGDLRPDIWAPPPRKTVRRSTDPELPDDRSGRNPPNADLIMSMSSRARGK